ncbi:MAG: ATP-binding protein [Marinibacterium profundimaris]
MAKAPDLTQRHTPRDFDVVLGCCLALMLTVVLSLSLFYSRDVLNRLEQLQSARSDNVQWTLTQVEVEHLSFLNALERREADGEADLPRVREAYDVLFSRLATLRNGSLFHDLVATKPEFRAALTGVHDFMKAAMPLIDGPDEALRAALPALAEQTRAARQEVRRLSTTGLAYFAVNADLHRREIAATLRRLAFDAASLLVLLTALSLYLLLVNRQKSRRGIALEQANHRMNTILSTSLDGVIVTDATGRVLEFNGAAETIFRLSSAEMKGRLVTDLFHTDRLRDGGPAAMAQLREGGARQIVGQGRVRREARRSDGEIFPMELAVQAAHDGEDEILIAFVRDVSQQDADEKKLVEAHDRALAGEKAKADFLTVMSHEIRTPLNGLLGNLSLLGGSDLTEEQRQFLRNMDVSGRILLKHVDAVLDIARFEAGKLQLAQEPVHVDELMQNLVGGQIGNAAGRGNRLDWAWVGPPQHWVNSDAQRIYQILLNLVGNAIKFTEQGRITIEAETDPAPLPDAPKRLMIEFRVSDTGQGIAEDQITTIFDDFHTSDTSFGRAAGGAGLGLGICRRITNAMGGEIGVESMPGEGSTFWVRLPVIPTEAPAPKDKPPSRHPVRGALCILVVEDNDINLQVTCSMLEREGHSVTCARDGQSGVEKANAHRFDLILMDISMPVLDGLEATRQIRAGCGPSAQAPIIALSANVLPQDTERFHAAGMDDFLGKPLTLDALRRALCTVYSGPTGVEEAGSGRAAEPRHAGAPGDRAAAAKDPGATDRPSSNPTSNAQTSSIDANKISDMRQTLGDAGFERLLGRFLDEADTLIRDLSAQDPQEDIAEHMIGRIHKVSGSAASFGTTEFRKLLNDTERAAKGELDMPLPELLARLAPCWQRTRVLLEA